MTPARWLATWFGAGLVPVAPGTAGTLAAVPLYLLVWALVPSGWVLAATAVAVAAAGTWAAGAAEREAGVLDPPEVVIDEVAGYLLACCGGPFDWRTAAGAFVLFRLADVLKPWPLRRLERLPRGWGIMLDDVGAGLLAGVVCWAAWGLAAGHWLGAFGR